MKFREKDIRPKKIFNEFLHLASLDIKKYFGGERIISIHRELTKMFEESYLGNINEAIDHFSSKKCKGEFVLIIAKEDYKL